MSQEELVRSVWKSGVLSIENDSRLERFLKLQDNPEQRRRTLIPAQWFADTMTALAAAAAPAQPQPEAAS